MKKSSHPIINVEGETPSIRYKREHSNSSEEYVNVKPINLDIPPKATCSLTDKLDDINIYVVLDKGQSCVQKYMIMTTKR